MAEFTWEVGAEFFKGGEPLPDFLRSGSFFEMDDAFRDAMALEAHNRAWRRGYAGPIPGKRTFKPKKRV